VKDILGDKPHLAVALNASRQKDSDYCLREAVVQLRVAGLPLKNLDPYQLDYKTSEKQKNNALSIRLHSVNHVSEKTQMAFEKALQCNHQVKLSTNTSKLSTVNASEVKSAPISEQQALKQNGHLVTNGVNHSIQTISRSNTVDTKVAPISEQQTPKQNGHLVTNGVNHSIQTTSRSNTVDTKVAPISEQQAPQQNGYLVTNGVNHSIQPTSRSNTMNPSEVKSTAISEISNQQILESEKQFLPGNPSNYQRILDGLEYGFIQFNQHQSEILHVHRQYLNNQMEYAKIFFQLIQQQNSLLVNGKSDNQQAQTKKIVVDSVERSMMQFHKHQAETLHIHEEYLKHQMEYSNNYFQLTRQQYSMLMADKSAHQRVVSNASTQDNPTILSTTKQDSSALSTTTADVVLTNELVTSFYHSSSNGAKHEAGKEHKQEESKNTHNFSESYPAFTNGSQPVQDSLVTIAQTDVTATVASPSPVAIDLETLSRTLVEVVSEKTGYPSEMLELSMDIEADLGIDSIKRVEILGALQELFPALPKPNNPEELAQLRTLGQIVEYMGGLLSETSQAESVPINLSPTIDVQQSSFITTPYPTSSNGSMNGAVETREEYKQEESENTYNLSENEIAFTNGSQPVQDSLVTTAQTDVTADVASPSPIVIDLETLSRTLVEVVSEKTGYPTEMLELSMDIEADLGIDSIKRVEILGALQELFPNLPKPNNPEELAQLRTLGQIVEYMGKQAESAEKKTFKHEFNSQHPELNHNIVRSLVKLKVLPKPDFLDFTFPQRHICLVTDDGSLTTSKLAQVLIKQGWKVIVLSFPQSLIVERSPLPEEITRIELADISEEFLKQQLEVIADTYGPIGAFIHLNPLFKVNQNDGIYYLEEEKAIIKNVFFIAKHLKTSLNKAAHEGRSCFCTVVRLDGAFGLGRDINFSPISAGLFGLTKTLNWEWQQVFCRAIDLSPTIDADESAHHIVSELHDPNCQITEVAYGSQGRVTLISVPE
jgi:acyl carrier protein